MVPGISTVAAGPRDHIASRQRHHFLEAHSNNVRTVRCELPKLLPNLLGPTVLPLVQPLVQLEARRRPLASDVVGASLLSTGQGRSTALPGCSFEDHPVLLNHLSKPPVLRSAMLQQHLWRSQPWPSKQDSGSDF